MGFMGIQVNSYRDDDLGFRVNRLAAVSANVVCARLVAPC